jgi:menaquinone-9 beta-reductase
MSPRSFDTDVFVVGGGPSGLAAAVAARQKGFRVVVADSARPPIDKACGEGVMPDGLDALRELGFRIGGAGPAPFRGIRFVDGDIAAEARFSIGPALGVRRTALHSAMAATAESAGVDLLWGAHVTGISRDGVWLGHGLVTARWIVGADGLHSRVRAWAGLDVRPSVRRRFGFRRQFQATRCLDFMELHWGHNAQIYMTPIGATEVSVVVISPDPHLRLAQALPEFPAVAAGLGRHCGPEVGAVTSGRRFPRVTQGRVALIGDASGSVDAITGEGLCLAFRQSLALAGALERNDLTVYERAHRRLMRRPALMGALLLSLAARPRLRRRVLSAFAARPALFQKMLAAHVGALSPAGFAANGFALGWQMLGKP